MRVLNLRPEAPPPRGSTSGIVARFDVQITENLRLNHLLLKRNSRGEYRTFPPNLRGTNAAHFAPALAEQLTAAVVAALQGGQLPNDDHRDAA